MSVTGLMWWIDRWRKSTAYIDMTLEEQGAYRNLLDEAFLRGGPIPNDERVLARACGDVTVWKRVRGAVLARFELRDGAYRNETLDKVIHETRIRIEKQKRYRDRKKSGRGGGNDPGNDGGNESGNAVGNTAGNDAGYRDQDPDQDERSTELERSTGARGRVFTGKRLRVSARQHAVVLDELGPRALALDFPVLYAAWDADLVASAEAFDTLAYIKRRASDAAASRPAAPAVPAVDWFEECQRLHGGACGGRLRHHNRTQIDRMRADAEMGLLKQA